MSYRLPDQSHLAHRKSKKVLLALPPALIAELDCIADLEHVTRSELIRECIRQFMRGLKRSEPVSSPMPQLAPACVEPVRMVATAHEIHR